MKNCLSIFILSFLFLLFTQITFSQEVKVLKGHTSNINTVVFSPDGKYFVTGSNDNNIIVWDVETGSLVRKIDLKRNDVYKIVFIGNTNKIAVGSNSDFLVHTSNGKRVNTETLSIWDVTTGKEIHFYEYYDALSDFAVSKDGSNIAFGLYENSSVFYAGGKKADRSCYCKIWKFNTENYKFEKVSVDDYHYSYEHGIVVKKTETRYSNVYLPTAFSSDGNLIALANHVNKNNKYEILVINSSSNNIIKRIPSNINKLIKFSPDDKNLIGVGGQDENIIQIYSIEVGKEIKSINAHEKLIYDISIYPNSNFLATCSKDETVKIWDLTTWKSVKTLKGHTNDVKSVAFSLSGKYLVTGCDDEMVRMFEITSITPEFLKYAMEYELNVGLSGSINKEKEEELIKISEKFKPKGEFETTEAYNTRIAEANAEKQAIEEKYAKKLYELKSQKQEEIEGFKNQVQDEKQKKIEESIKDTILHIDKIGNYNADKETFPISIAFKTVDINIPLADAVEFKKVYAKAIVRAKKKLNYNLNGWEYYEMVIVNPNNNAEYIFK